MKALGSFSAICTTSYSLYNAEINSRKEKSRFFHRACITNRQRISLVCHITLLQGASIRCSTICLTKNGYVEAFDVKNCNLPFEREKHAKCYLGNEDQAMSGFGKNVAAANEELGSKARVDPALLNSDSLDSSSFCEVWRKLGNGSEMKLHFLEERDEEVLSKRIVSLGRSNKMRSALEMYLSMEMAGLKLTPHACNSLISCILRNGSVDDALRVFGVLRRKGIVTGHAYSLVLKAVAADHGCDCALNMFLDLEEEGLCNRTFDIIVYNTMLTICGKARNWREAERIWCKLKEHGFHVTKVTYSLLISTFVQCGQTDLALSAYCEMIQNGFQSDEGNMKAIIATCTSEGRWDVAVDILKEMLDNGGKPNIVLFNAVLNCLGKAGEVDHAFEIYDLMRSSGHTPDTYTWNSLLSALYRSRRYADCLHLFSTISKKHSSDMNFHLFNTVLMSCQKLGLWDRSLQILWLMESSGMQVPTASYNLVIGSCENARKPKAALQVFQHMTHRNCLPDTFTYMTLIRACIWGSLWTEMESILEHVEPNASLYNALIHGFCLRGKITLAKKLYAQMRNSGLEVDGRTRALMLQHIPKETIRHPRYAKQKRVAHISKRR